MAATGRTSTDALHIETAPHAGVKRLPGETTRAYLDRRALASYRKRGPAPMLAAYPRRECVGCGATWAATITAGSIFAGSAICPYCQQPGEMVAGQGVA